MAIAVCLCLLFAGSASAQWVVSDPGNLAQGIINASKNIVHTASSVTSRYPLLRAGSSKPVAWAVTGAV